MTDEEKKSVVQDVLNEIQTNSQSVDELDTATSLDGINSLPAQQGEKLVRVPVSLLGKVADDAADTAKKAASAADAATKVASSASNEARSAAEIASNAALTATKSATTADAATARLNEAIAAANTHPVILVNDLIGDPNTIFDSWVAAKDEVKQETNGGEKLFTTGCVMIFHGQNGWESWQFIGAPENDLDDAEKWQEYATGGSGGNTYNVTEEVPMDSGYYTLETAIKAVETNYRAKGRCVTYETAQGKWETKQFIGTSLDSWEQAASWEDFGGAGTVKSVTVNGQKQAPDSTGNVSITINETEVDESLNESSTNPVQNAAVTAKLNEVEASTVAGMSTEVSEDGGTVRLALTNKSGAEIASADIPARSGGGGGESTTTRIVLGASVDNGIIKEGGEARLTWNYDHQYSSGDEKGTSTGQKATVTIEMKRGATLMYADTQQDVSSEVALTLDTDLIVNDPQYIYGASRIMEMDLTDVSHAILQTLNLNNCRALRSLDVSCAQTQTTLNALLVNGCRNLRILNMTGLKSAGFTGIDLSGNTKLETLKAGKSALTGVNFAQGAPLTSVTLPATLQTLELRYLSKLTNGGLTLEGTSNITRLVVDNCPGIDWQTLYGRCANVRYLRVTGIDMEGDGSLLTALMDTGGVDENGGNVDTCRLVGTYRLTSYKGDEEYAALQAHFPELNIVQPEYTMIEFDETVADDANISNMDNGTGYKYGNTYKPSGHIEAILKNRHRVLAKVTKKATTRNVNIANVDTIVNNLDGEMTYYPLDDTDSRKYADGSPAKLDGTEGDLMMLEPFFWSKGVNDYLNGKNYSCYCYKDRDHMPAVPNVDVLTLDDIKATQGGYMSGRKVMSGRDTISNAYSTDSSYSVCVVGVKGYKKVRFPSVPGTNLVGSAFVDESGNIVKDVVVSTLGSKFEAGMYLIADVPENATALHFSILNTAEFDKVVLNKGEKVEDMEPDWFANDEHLCAVVGSTVVGSKLRACVSGGSTTGSMTWVDFHYYSVQRGMQQIDALMHFRIANLTYAKYGRKNVQEQCGAGQHTYLRTTGGTMSRGMQDTIGFDEAKSVNANVTDQTSDSGTHLYAWYKDKDEYGAIKVTQVNNICCLGYEDIYGNKYDMMDGVDLPNTSGNAGKWRIWMPDGSTIMIKGTTNSDYWITAVAHGKLMAIVPIGSVNGSSSTYYGDKYWMSTSTGRVVYRGYYNAGAHGGVSNANASSDASYANASVGSRLAFRGIIVKAQSVEAYKALLEVA